MVFGKDLPRKTVNTHKLGADDRSGSVSSQRRKAQRDCRTIHTLSAPAAALHCVGIFAKFSSVESAQRNRGGVVVWQEVIETAQRPSRYGVAEAHAASWRAKGDA